MNNKNKGHYGEDIASLFLKKRGFSILYRNFSCNLGEIDIIAKKDRIIVFVEVKYRSSLKKGSPEEMINYYKKKHILNTAKYFLLINPNLDDSYTYRFDLIAISDEGEIKINHIENIIEDNLIV